MFISVGHFYQDLTGIEEIDRCKDIPESMYGIYYGI